MLGGQNTPIRRKRHHRDGKRVVVAGRGEIRCNQTPAPICLYFAATGLHSVIMRSLPPEASSFPSGENATELMS